MNKLTLYSSKDITNALIRGGFEIARKSKRGSHLSLKKKVGQGTRVVIVPQGKKEIPRGTFSSILRQAGISDDEFVGLL